MPKVLQLKEVKEIRSKLAEDQQGIDPILGVPFPDGKLCLDHDHDKQNVRAALHLQTNAFEGKVTNAYTRCLKWLTDVPLPEILRNLANYLEKDYSENPYHPSCKKVLLTRFRKLTASEQALVLRRCDVVPGTNNKAREDQLKAILTRSYDFDTIQLWINEAKEQ